MCTVIRTVRSVPVGRHGACCPHSQDNHDEAADHLDAALCPEATLAIELTL
jgi:hypothetical protein